VTSRHEDPGDRKDGAGEREKCIDARERDDSDMNDVKYYRNSSRLSSCSQTDISQVSVGGSGRRMRGSMHKRVVVQTRRQRMSDSM
jgi:hypothetical protein